MTWLAPALDSRVQILIPSQNPNDDGGFDLEFGNPLGQAFDATQFDNLAPVLTVWMSIKPVGYKGAGSKYIRGEQVNEAVTHEFDVRQVEIDDLGKEFGLGFSSCFKYMPNLMGLKGDYFLFVQEGSSYKGRLFRIHDTRRHKEKKEFLIITAEEIEERGTGWPV